MLDPLSPVPTYVQPADLIAKQIEDGKLVPLGPIPSETQLRGEYGGLPGNRETGCGAPSYARPAW